MDSPLLSFPSVVFLLLREDENNMKTTHGYNFALILCTQCSNINLSTSSRDSSSSDDESSSSSTARIFASKSLIEIKCLCFALSRRVNDRCREIINLSNEENLCFYCTR